MILQAASRAIKEILQGVIDDATSPGAIPVYEADSDVNKDSMPYVIIGTHTEEEQIAPGCGIFKVEGTLEYRSLTKETTPGQRETVCNAINSFSYSDTAKTLSKVQNFHCHGWQPASGKLTLDNDRKATVYQFTYWIFCSEVDEETTSIASEQKGNDIDLNTNLTT